MLMLIYLKKKSYVMATSSSYPEIIKKRVAIQMLK